jgi:hypothetical protein
MSFTNKVKVALAVVVIVIFSANFIWQGADAIIVNQQYHFSHNDINKLYDVETQLGEIIGTSVVKSKVDVLYNLVISAVQKSILNKNNIKIDKEKAVQLVEQNNQNFKGIYQKFKQQLGSEDYYRLLIEPVFISQTFLRFYYANEPAKRRSNVALKIAQEKGIKASAKEFKQEIVDVNIDKNNAALMQKFLSFKPAKVDSVIYPRTIKIGGYIAILDLKFNKNIVDAKGLTFKIMSYKDFLTKLSDKITMDFPIYSRYSLNDIYNKKGSILQ